MAQIRSTKIRNIYNKIQASKIFSLDDFRIDFPDTGNVLAKITFRASDKYSFCIEENTISNGIFDIQLAVANKKREMVLQTIEKPGGSKNIEIHSHETLDRCIERIPSWLYNLDEDLKNEFNSTEIEDIPNIEEFERKLNEKFPNENEKFSTKEKESLLEKINELQARIEKLEQNDNTQKQIEILEQSKSELEKYPKKAWWLKFYNRLSNLNNGFALLNSLADNIKKLVDNIG